MAENPAEPKEAKAPHLENHSYTTIIANRDDQLYYRPNCPSYRQIAQENSVEFESETEAEAAGYHLRGNVLNKR